MSIEQEANLMSDKVKQLSVRVPPAIHRQAKIQAARTGRNLQEILEELIKDWLAKEAKAEQPANK